MKENLILDNINLIYYVLKQLNLYEKCDDYFDVGMIGLVKAANTYDENSGYAFSTYAYTVIMHEIHYYIRKENCAKRQHSDISLSKVVYDDGKKVMTLGDIIPSDINIEQEICEKESIEELYKCIQKLEAQEKVILIYYYGLYNTRKHNQSEIAEELCISQTYVSRIIKRAKKKLKKMLGGYI